LEKLQITINSDSQNVNELLTIYYKLGRMPNRIVLHDQYLGDKFEEVIKPKVFIQDGFQGATSEYRDVTTSSELVPTFNGHILNERILTRISGDVWCSYLKLEKDSGEFIVDNVCLYYGSESISEIIELVKGTSIAQEGEQSIENINILTFSNNNLDTEPLYLEEIKISDLHTKKTTKAVKKIISQIEERDSGLTIIKGSRGLGKTTISRYIAQNIELVTLIIPLNLVDLTINNPDFKNFLKKFGKCLLIIDDCEYNYGMNKSKSYLTGNILQSLETLDQDIHFILVFNCDHNYDIDPDLIESEYLIDQISLEPLDPKRATHLSKSLGHSIDYESDVTLSKVIRGDVTRDNNKIGLI